MRIIKKMYTFINFFPNTCVLREQKVRLRQRFNTIIVHLFNGLAL